MKRRPSIVHFLFTLVIFFGIWSCAGGGSGAGGGGSAAPGGVPGAPMGPVGGGSINQALPGMDEVPLGPTVDRDPKRVLLTCVKIQTTYEHADDSYHVVDDDAPQYAAVSGPYRLKIITFLGPLTRVIRIVDRNLQTYRQMIPNQGLISLKWDENQSSPRADFYVLPKGSDETTDQFQACPNGPCHDSMMEEKTPCLLDNSCRAWGWDYPKCPLIDID